MPSTRQLKIGLSNADKTNMANSVASSTLNTIINGEITVGSETTNLSEKISDINEAVASVADKAEVDGNYPSLTAGYSENLTPYGANSGVLDDTPFVFQTSGGESDIGAFAQIKNLKGKSVAWNQLVNYIDRTINSVVCSSSNGIYTLNGTASGEQSNTYLSHQEKRINGHKYLWIIRKIGGTVDITQRTTNTYGGYYFNSNLPSINAVVNLIDNETHYQIITSSSDSTNANYFRIAFDEGVIFDNAQFICMTFDLTSIYGAGNEPTSIEEFEADFLIAYYSYDAGSIISTKPKAYKIVGYNAFDGEFVGTTYKQNKNLIRVVAGQTYVLEQTETGFNAKVIYQYDIDENVIKATYLFVSQTKSEFTVEDNCCYIRFIYDYTGITVSTPTNVCVHLKWDGSREGYEEYYDETYQLPNIELRSAGTVYDELFPDGTLIRRVGTVDLGSLSWDWDSGKNAFLCYGLPNPLNNTNNTGLNLLCAKYKTRGMWSYAALNDKEISTRSNFPYIYIRDDSFNGDTAAFKTAMSGVMLYYELATPTIAQSDDYKFVENTMIDDFGTQEILSDEDIVIAQPIEIFYSVDYKAFIDSLGGREDIEYNASNVVSKNDMEEYACSKDGDYENVRVGNLITDQNWRWTNDFSFSTGTVDTVFDGEATLYSIRGHTEWDGTTPHYVNVVSNKSVIFNLYNPENHYAHVVASDDENNGLCIFGTGITDENIVEFCEDSSFSDITELSLDEETNSTGEVYLRCWVPDDGYVRIKNAEPEDLCIANVWGGNRVSHHPEYEEAIVNINSATYFPTGMKSITINGEEIVYDEMYANKYFARIQTYTFSATPVVTYQTSSGSYNIYKVGISYAMDKGACVIGGSTKFAWTNVGKLESTTPIDTNCMSLYTNYIYFAIAQSEDTTYTYSEDSEVVDAESFASELSEKGSLYVLDGTDYVSASEYTEGTTYYYISATNLHGLNGKAINDEIANKTIVFQRYSMDKTVYTGTAISPIKNWNYHMGDFGTEELILENGFTATPKWIVYYPINVLETVQQLPNNYVSLESAENLLHQVGDLQGFDFDSVNVDEDTGTLKINGLVDNRETVVNVTIANSKITSMSTRHAPICKFDRISNVLYLNFSFQVTANIVKETMFLLDAGRAGCAFFGSYADVTQIPVVKFATRDYYSITIRPIGDKNIWQIASRETAQTFTAGEYFICAAIKLK